MLIIAYTAFYHFYDLSCLILDAGEIFSIFIYIYTYNQKLQRLIMLQKYIGYNTFVALIILNTVQQINVYKLHISLPLTP